LNLIFLQKFLIFSELRPDLSGNPFFSMAKALAKKRLGAEGGIWRSKNIIYQLF
jgi:hypothetical protein